MTRNDEYIVPNTLTFTSWTTLGGSDSTPGNSKSEENFLFSGNILCANPGGSNRLGLVRIVPRANRIIRPENIPRMRQGIRRHD